MVCSTSTSDSATSTKASGATATALKFRAVSATTIASIVAFRSI